MIDIIKEALFGSVKSVYSMGMIVIPLMIVLQIAKDYEVLNRISNLLRFATRLLGISRPSILPLLVGVFFGISYGAGVIIDSSNGGHISKKDGILLMVFFSACHGIIEDTLIFVLLGANPLIVVTVRVLAAVLITYYLSRRMEKKDKDILKEV